MTSHVESKTFFYGKGDWLEGVGADEGSQLSYMEGCTAPMRDENQLHAAVQSVMRAVVLTVSSVVVPVVRVTQ